ncbi:disintegrin and metalloproteinase domain-containing protein 10-like isoform X3 [Crotalus tigris]|uniref:disintegrin and metalloproteinase domain-containing protein 10-like isoform X3 n=1 Tax=Crotalus tigris TaxID=88082 RepID=UPI00192FB287|nr:disintegrin and metalloproteinase domain-containing protein 10-like isoform X3 [Crotalus tigris]
MIFFWYFNLPFWNLLLSQMTCSASEASPGRALVKSPERLSYDRAALEKMHREVRRGERRSLWLEFRALQRSFRLHLWRDMSVFVEDVEIVMNDTSEPADVSFVYSGTLQGDAASFCHGSIIHGVFEGFVQTQNGTYYIESAAVVKGAPETHSLIHHQRDLDYKLLHDSKSASLAQTLHQQLQDFQRQLTAKANHPHRPRRSLNYSKTSCLLHFQADHLFYRRFGSVEAVIAQIASYVKAVNAIYEAAEFGRIGTIEFKVKTITIVQEEDPSRTPFLSPEMLLMLHSKTNWDGYCLSYLLTDRDYSGVLGIAFSGQPGDSGGICSKYQHFLEKEASLNTGLITLQKYGQLLPPRMIHITLAHEFGHSLGAQHDQTKECSRFDLNTSRGKFLMFNYATDGTEFNNDKFSPCSIAYISNILEHKKDQCFAETDRPICGNQIVDPGEECDVGSDNEDACCYGAGEPRGIQCRLKPGASCSPSQGLCCERNCVLKPLGQRCQEESECALGSLCTGSSPACPELLPKANFTPCGLGLRLCSNGLCEGSLCIQHGLEECQCVSSPLRGRCGLCCQLPGQAATCVSTSSKIWDPFFNGSDIPLLAGSPCGDKNGYCDKFHICRFVDEDGPIARVKNFILDFIEMDDLATWMQTHWCAILLVVLTLAAMMAGTVFLFGRTVSNESGKEIISETMKPGVGLDQGFSTFSPSVPLLGYGNI